MALTKVQERLIDRLKIFGVHRDQAVAMMVFMKDDEPGMLELIRYMEDNNPTAFDMSQCKDNIRLPIRTRYIF